MSFKITARIRSHGSEVVEYSNSVFMHKALELDLIKSVRSGTIFAHIKICLPLPFMVTVWRDR